MINLYNEDCHIGLERIEDNSIDLILCDPPYGTTPLEWDSVLDYNILWKQYKRILKIDGCILIFGQEPFSSYIRLSNIEWYKYDWYWEKERLTNIFQVKNRPGKTIETISVFYKNKCKYFSQKRKHDGKLVSNKISENKRFSQTQGDNIKPNEYIDNGTRHPSQVLKFNRDNLNELIHPTQKPLELIKFLIKSYTEEENVVLDHCMGSGTTGVACKELKRKFIGFETDTGMFVKAKERIQEYVFKKEFF
jgi:DNA modification methylase